MPAALRPAEKEAQVRPFIIVTGLPASGKTTVGRSVAAALSLPLFDKDDVLEAMFESLGAGDANWRTRLSRAADQVLAALVARSAGAVVVSWWKHPRSESSSGTETRWLASLPAKVVELHCRCSPEVAVARFFSRNRHAGHLDALKSRAGELAMFERVAAWGPLGVGPVVVCDTEAPLNLPAITRALNAALH